MAKLESVKLPAWAVPDDAVSDLIPSSGWLKDYMEYAVWASDCPSFLHLGAAITTLCVAASNADIVVESEHAGGQSEIPLVLWSLLIAPSGSRKSTAAKIPMEMLRRSVRQDKNWGEVILPAEGSIEGWVEFLKNHNNAVLYRTEFSTVLSQSARSYTSGLKPWLLSLYECEEDWERKTLSGGSVTIERPRLSILGPIPPKTFRKNIDRIDWSTGFLARMTYWLGIRTRRNRLGLKNKARVSHLTQWLQRVGCQTKGIVHVRKELMLEVDDWIVANIESRRGRIDEDIFSHLERYQSMIYVFAAVYAISRRMTPQETESSQVNVGPEDIECALKLAKVLLESTLAFFDVSFQDERTETGTENVVLESIESCPDPTGATVEWIRQDLIDRGYDAISRAALYRTLKSLKECGDITPVKDLRKSYKFKYLATKK